MMKKSRTGCKACDFRCNTRVELDGHMEKVHGAKSEQDMYISIMCGGVHPTCMCGCGSQTKYAGWVKGFCKFLLGHNGNIYGIYSEDVAKEISNKRKEKLTGRVGWSRGLTKENNDSLKVAAETRSKTVKAQFENGERQQWSKGKTKETDERIARFAVSLREGYASGAYKPWALGKTKETDPRLAEMSEKFSIIFSERAIRDRLDRMKRLNPEEILRRLSENAGNMKLITPLSEYVSEQEENLEFECAVCETRMLYSLRSALNNRCYACDPAGSVPQVEVSRFVHFLGYQADLCDRNIIAPYEIDIVIQGTDLCIEYNGLYFHSEVYKHYEYHSMKSDMCKEVGKNLFHVFSDEWMNKQEIIKSMIAHRLGSSSKTIGARKCIIKKLGSKERRDFFNENHIDGDALATMSYGLIYNDEIVAAISLRKPFHKKYGGYFEVSRFCTKKFISVPGGLGRLSKIAMEECKKLQKVGLLSYVDRRYGAGKGYSASGYVKIGETANRFWWTDGKIRIDRFKVRANKKEGLTEREAAERLGVVKVWGCPNEIYVMNV